MDDDLIRAITEMHIFKRDLALNIRMSVRIVDLHRVFTLRHLFLFFQEGEDTLCGSGRRLQDVHVLRDHGDRLVEAAHIRDERLDITDGDRPIHRQIAAQDGHADIAQIADKCADRLHQSAEEL